MTSRKLCSVEQNLGNDLIQSCISPSALITNLQPLTLHQTDPLPAFLVSFPFGSHWLSFQISVLWNLKCPIVLCFSLIKKASGFKVSDIIQGINLLHTPNKSFHSHLSAEIGDAAFTPSQTLSMDSSWMQPES